MGLAAQQAETMSDAQAALRAKSEALANTIQSQKDKIDILTQRVEYAATLIRPAGLVVLEKCRICEEEQR